MIRYLIAGLFFLALTGLDFYTKTADLFRDGKTRFALIGGVVMLFLFLKKHYGVGFSLFVSYVLSFTIINNYLIYSFFSAFLMMAVPLLAYAFNKYLGRTLLEKVIIAAGAIEAVLGCLQYFFGIHLIYRPLWDSDLMPGMLSDVHEVVGSLGQHTVLGSFLVLTLAPALWRSAYVSVGLISFCILLTRSSMSIGAMVVVFGLYLLHKFGTKSTSILWGTIAAVGLIVWALSPDLYFGETRHSMFKLMGRDKVWPIAWDVFRDAPILGHGLGYWGMWSVQNIGLKFQTVWEQVHSDPLQMLVEQGLVGLAACIYAAYEFIKGFRLDWPQVLIIGMLVNSLANFPFHLITHALLFCLAWMFCMNKNEGSLCAQ